MDKEIKSYHRWDHPKQTIFGRVGGPKNVLGDCFRCCVAAVLELPACDVPHFVQMANVKGTSWEGIAQSWMNSHGLWLIVFETNSIFGNGEPFYLPCDAATEVKPLPIICSGPTIRSKDKSQTHAVVVENGRIVYDPHPSDAGLLAVTRRYVIVPQL